MTHTQEPQLQQYEALSNGSMLHRCPECWRDATGGFDNGYSWTLPYPHARYCPVRRNQPRYLRPTANETISMMASQKKRGLAQVGTSDTISRKPLTDGQSPEFSTINEMGRK